MPSHRVVTATAEWAVTNNWARAADLRLGRSLVEVSGRMFADRAPLAALQTPLRPTRKGSTDQEPRLVWLRTVLADLRRAVRNRKDSRRRIPTIGPADVRFVWEYHSPFFRRGRAMASALGCPVVRFVAAPQVWEARRWGVRRRFYGTLLETFAEVPGLRAADVICCVSTQVRDAVIEIAGVEPRRVLVTPNTCPAVSTPPRPSGSAFRSAWGVSPGTVLIGWSGSFRRFHDLDFLLDAVTRVRCRKSDWRVVLLGEGSTRAEVERRIAAEHLPIQCVGAIDHDSMPSALAAWQAAVMPLSSAALFHYSPLKLREYSAAALPIVAPDVADSRHLLGSNGALFYPPGNAEELATHLASLIDDEPLRTHLSATVKARHAESGETGSEMDRLLAALEDLGL